jgi:hypothetical protein
MKRISVMAVAIAICTLGVVDASAQANLALKGIGLKVGVVNPEQLSSTLGFSVIADLGTVHPKVALESYAGYWSQTQNDFGTEFGVNDISFGGKAKYLFTTNNPTLTPYASAGLGLHIMNAHVDLPAGSFGGFPGATVEDTNVDLGLDLGGGLRIDRGSQFSFVGELAYSIVSDVNQFSFMLGAVYMFGR